ncbi:hypothetical protein [Salinisphaera dokdonensis]|uniref:hypothetical protein n=1 Tax=Salinisphaera dokdonensis TaxID=454598 RepID=UPI00333E481F
MNHNRRTLLIGVLAGLGLLATPNAIARRRRRIYLPHNGLSKGSNYSGPILSRQELRECLSQQNKINAGSQHLDNLEASVHAKAQEIEQLESLIQQREPLVDRYSQYSVDNFNRLIEKHRELVKEYNARLRPINQQVSVHQANVEEFNKTCADHQYYQSDMDAIRRRN